MTKLGKFLGGLIKPFLSHSERDVEKEEDLESIAAEEQKLFSFETLVAATQDFNLKNKLGEGGFGPVYKGKLDDGRAIAVKKLSHSPNQGKEFQNEARLLARVQHRNVVHLLGYCVYAEEKFLVYEYVAHESLDKFLFHAEGRAHLDWKRRYDVIVGVARGLLYLHENCHTVIIHRDVKASNILLDEKWVPKLADFGMVRFYPEAQTHVNTRVAGYNGYMAPEYAMHGQLSLKADVFSFGVLILELVSGKKNSFDYDPDSRSLLEWAYRLFRKQRPLEIMDPTLASTQAMDQVRICIQVGLLCTQAERKIRPTMQQVVTMLSKKPGTLPDPTRPGYPGSRYRRTQRPGGITSSGESSSRAVLASGSSSTSTSNTNTASTSTIL